MTSTAFLGRLARRKRGRQALRRWQRGFFTLPAGLGVLRGAGGGGGAAVTALLLHFDGTNGALLTADSAQPPKMLRLWNGAQLSTAQSVFGGASLFLDGTDDFCEIAICPQLQMGSNDFCIEGRMRPASISGARRQIFWYGNDGNFNNSVSLCILSTGAIEASVRDATTSDTATSSTGLLTANTWYHVAMVRGGGTLRIYLDGTQVASVACTRTIGIPGTVPTANLGRQYGPTNGTAFFSGYLDEWRITKGSEVYTSGFTPAGAAFSDPAADDTTDPNFALRQLLLHFNGTNGSTTITDSGPLANSCTATNGASLSTSQVVFGSASLSLDGVNDYVALPGGSNFLVGADDFSLECRIRVSSSTGNNRVVFWSGGDGNFFNSLSLIVQNDGSLYAAVFDGSAGDAATSAASAVTLNTWYDIAVVRNGGTLRIYQDGTQVASVSSSRNQGTPGSHFVNIGANYGTSFRQGWFPGFVDELRFTKNFGTRVANFTSRTSAFPNSA